MDEIVIISENKGKISPLASLVKELFPGCKVTMVSRENGKIEKVAREGGQYVENAERR